MNTFRNVFPVCDSHIALNIFVESTTPAMVSDGSPASAKNGVEP